MTNKCSSDHQRRVGRLGHRMVRLVLMSFMMMTMGSVTISSSLFFIHKYLLGLLSCCTLKVTNVKEC